MQSSRATKLFFSAPLKQLGCSLYVFHPSINGLRIIEGDHLSKVFSFLLKEILEIQKMIDLEHPQKHHCHQNVIGL